MEKPGDEIITPADGQNPPEEVVNPAGLDDDLDLHMYYHTFYGF